MSEPAYTADPGAVGDMGVIHRGPLERALREEREHADRLAAALARMMPLAVGYADRHGVEINRVHVAEADAALASHEARRKVNG